MNLKIIVTLVTLFLISAGIPLASSNLSQMDASDDGAIDDTSSCGCELEIKLVYQQHCGIIMIIKNIGNSNCTNVKWSISFDGGFILLSRYTSGTISCIPPGENVAIHSLIFGFGRTIITVSVESAEGSSDWVSCRSLIFGIFIMILRPLV